MKQEVKFRIFRCPDGTVLDGFALLNTVTGEVKFSPGSGVEKTEDWQQCVKSFGAIRMAPGFWSMLCLKDGKWHTDPFRKLFSVNKGLWPRRAQPAPEPFTGMYYWGAEMVEDTGLAEDQGLIHRAVRQGDDYTFITLPKPKEEPAYFLVKQSEQARNYLLSQKLSFKEVGDRFLEVESTSNLLQAMMMLCQRHSIDAVRVPR